MPQLCTFGASSARGFGLTEETGPGLPDDQFNLTTLLLPGNGTNGAQNNTFLDSSTNNLTITRNGNTTQGTFSPFSFGGGTAQADGYYSGYFDGTGDYLSIPTSNVLMHQIGNWTYEGWIFWNVMPSTGYQNIFGQGAGGQNSFGLTAYNGSTWSAPYKFVVNQANIGDRISGTTTIVANMWYHFAVVRNSGVITLYVNGRAEGTYSNSTDYTFGGNPFTIGDNSNARISNFRFNRSAVYTSNFTVPTTPLTAIANTSLLTCQSSQFIDNSTNAFAITSFGNSQPVPTNPFGMTDWSGYFDGSGDYLSVADNAALDMGSSDFTMECWVYLNEAASASDGIFAKRADIATYGGVLFYINSTTPALRATTNGSTWGVDISSSITIRVGIWTHLAITRSGSTWTIWVNGVSGATATLSGTVPDNSSAFVIAAYDSGGNASYIFPSGLISNARVVKGTAVYTSTFTPPTAPLTAISGTSLLTCQSSTFIDNSANAFAITVNGNAYTGTLNNPFDSPANYDKPALQYWSNYFDGTGDYLTIPELNIPASTSFTIEFWFYWSSAPSVFSMFISEDGGNSSKYIGYNVAGATLDMQMGGSASTVAYCSFTPTLNTWYHLAFVRNTNTAAIYVNGVAQTMTQATQSGAFLDVGTINYIGRWAGTSPYAVNGYMSNFRAVVGAAVYNSNFTVPTTPLTAIQNTQLLTCQSNRFVDNSISARAITRYGNTSVQAFSPFQPTEPYSTTSVGGSVYFDGSNSKLTTSANIDISGLFTIECWYNLTVAPGGWFFTIGNLPVYVDVTAGQITLDKSSVGVQLTTTANEQAKGTNCWKHLAITRDAGGVIRVFVNGIQVGSVTTSYSAGILNGLGAYANYGGNIAGYISNFRVIAGSALYTSNFVPPTAPLTAVSGTSLLVSAINGGITDATAKNVLETVGNAQISTAQSKFGGSSMYFDKTDDRLTFPSSQNYNFGTGDFTVEFWMNSNDVSGANTPGILQTSDTVGGLKTTYTSGLCIFQGATATGSAQNGALVANIIGTGVGTNAGGIITAGAWYHIAIVRASGVCTVYVNGTAQPVTATISGAISGQNLVVGGYYNTSYLYSGYLDDLRITKGYARYTTNFTPPTSAFPLY